MSARKIQLLLIVITLGIGSALLLMQVGSPPRDNSNERQISVAYADYEAIKTTRRITRGSLVSSQDFEVVSLKSRPTPDTIAQPTDAVGRVALRDISPGEFISTTNTSDNARAEGLAKLIPSGFRAVALGVSDEIAVGNLIRAGDRVDVLVVSKLDRTSGGDRRTIPDTEARLLLQDVQVLAVGPAVVGSAPKEATYRNVTLAVTPKQSAVLALARSVGTYYLALRALDDKSFSGPIAVGTEDLRLDESNHGTDGDAQPIATERVIEVISGSSKRTEVVPRQANK